MDWFRWHNGTHADPKWRAISRRSGASVPAVVAVWAALCENANQSPERGTLANWSAEDTAAALDMETEEVEAVVAAMRGKVMDGDHLTGWERRNPKREDETAADRKRRQREKSRDVTQGHAGHAPRERGEREGDSELETDPSSVIQLRARDAIDPDLATNEIIRAANRGMIDNPAIGSAANPIPISHSSRQNVRDWLDAGIPADIIAAAVYERAKGWKKEGTRKQVTTMAYFSGAVQDAFERFKANQTEVPNGRGDSGATAQVRGKKAHRLDHLIEGNAA